MKPAPLTNVARLRHLLSVAPLDAVIASSPENLAYCSGYHGQDLYMLKERQHFALWTADTTITTRARPPLREMRWDTSGSTSRRCRRSSTR